jgi:cyanophycin synthetase
VSILDDKFASYKLLTEPLKKLGYTLSLRKNENDKLIATFKNTEGKTWETRAGGLNYPFNKTYTEKYSVNKDMAYVLVEKEGIPIPRTFVINLNSRDEELKEILKKYKPLVVKPTNSSLSKGLTININNLTVLKKAINKASHISDPILVQEQVSGEEVRIVILNGELAGALLRQTARVIGDGTSTVSALIKKENRLRAGLHLKYITYPQLDEHIIDKKFLKNGFILKKGEVIELNKSTMISGGCSVYNVSDKINLEYVNIAQKLTKKIGAGFLAVDLFCDDFTEPPTNTNYHFIEFNKAPVLKLFYSCRDGKHIDIIPKLTNLINAQPATQYY